MSRYFSVISIVGLLYVLGLSAQSGSVIPQGGAGHAPRASCVILKRMGPADQVTSRAYSFGIRGKQFQYIEGKLPDGFPFHGRLTDHDVRNLQGRGAEVLILEAHYTSEDLKQAREDCRGETGKAPNQSDPKTATPQQTVTSDSRRQNTGPAQEVTQSAVTKISVSSTPTGADIEVDSSFVGNTPSNIEVPSGEHTVTVSKNGYRRWERKLKASGGNVNLNVELEAK